MTRRKLFDRGEADHPLTPKKLQLLIWIAELGILTVPQLATLSQLTEKSVRGHMRDLFDLGLVDRVGVHRAALMDVDAPNTNDLLYGRAPTIYTLSKEGARALVSSKLVEKSDIEQVAEYGPKNSLFLAHELQIRDVRVWLENVRRHNGHEGVVYWVTDARAYFGPVQPDAWLTYQTGTTYRIYFVEVDRGTEKSRSRWQKKVREYADLFNSGLIEQQTGVTDYRLLVFTPNARRTQEIWETITDQLVHTPTKSGVFWISARSHLEEIDKGITPWSIAQNPNPSAFEF